MRFQLGQVDDYLCLKNLTRDQVTMTTRRMRFRHQPRVVTRDTKRWIVSRDWLQQTLVREIEKHKAIFGLHVFIGDSDAIHKCRYGATKITNALESCILTLKVTRPLVQFRIFQEQIKITTLYRRIANQHFRRISQQSGFGGSLDQRLMGEQGRHAAWSTVLVHDEIRFDDYFRTALNHMAQRSTFGGRPSEHPTD